MVDVVEKHGVKFNYGTQRRYMPFYRKVRELVDAGEIGDVQCTIAQYGASSALWGLTHAADMLLFLAGDPGVDFVQGTIVCKDSDWDGNQLNVDPAITGGYIRFANGVHGYNRLAPALSLRCAAPAAKIRHPQQQPRMPISQERGDFP